MITKRVIVTFVELQVPFTFTSGIVLPLGVDRHHHLGLRLWRLLGVSFSNNSSALARLLLSIDGGEIAGCSFGSPRERNAMRFTLVIFATSHVPRPVLIDSPSCSPDGVGVTVTLYISVTLTLDTCHKGRSFSAIIQADFALRSAAVLDGRKRSEWEGQVRVSWGRSGLGSEQPWAVTVWKRCRIMSSSK